MRPKRADDKVDCWNLHRILQGDGAAVSYERVKPDVCVEVAFFVPVKHQRYRDGYDDCGLEDEEGVDVLHSNG